MYRGCSQSVLGFRRQCCEFKVRHGVNSNFTVSRGLLWVIAIVRSIYLANEKNSNFSTIFRGFKHTLEIVYVHTLYSYVVSHLGNYTTPRKLYDSPRQHVRLIYDYNIRCATLYFLLSLISRRTYS